NGQILSIAQNTALFSLLGTTFGGNGQTTFGLPDLRGRAPLHWGQGPGLSSYVEGEAAGSESVTLTATQAPAHAHPFAPGATQSAGDSSKPGNRIWATSSNGDSNYSSAAADIAMNGGNTGPAGGNQPHANMQPYLA